MGRGPKGRAPPHDLSLENDEFSAIFTHNDKKLNRQTNYKQLYVDGAFPFLKKLHFTLPLREKTPSITQKPQNHCFFFL